MNFLAHLYLSGQNEGIMVGNFIGDYVKGREFMFYPEEIRKGIYLHRYIDTFTDSHPVSKQSRKRFQKEYRKYSGIVVDIFYDYFLASDWSKYHPTDLQAFVDNVFIVLKKYYYEFPQGIKNWFPNFIRNNWLMSYSTIDGIERILHRMSSRTSLPANTESAIKILRDNEAVMREEFEEFFDSIRTFVRTEHGIYTGEPVGGI